jgi:hypothetical protein
MMLLFSLFVFSSANAQQPCDITVSPSGEVIFESVNGAAVYKVFTVTNTSTSATVEVNVQMGGAPDDTSAFSHAVRNFTLQPGGKKEVKVYFKPYANNVQRYSATLNFSVSAGVVCTTV